MRKNKNFSYFIIIFLAINLLYLLFPAKSIASNKLKVNYYAGDYNARIILKAKISVNRISYGYLKKQRLLFIDFNQKGIRISRSKYNISDTFVKRIRISKYTVTSVRTVIHLQAGIYYTLLKNDNEIIINLKYKRNTYVPKLPKTEIAADSKLIVIIDPGHGGVDPGTGWKSILEKNIVLRLGKYLYSILQTKQYKKRFKPILTRKKDKYLSLYQRRQIANKLKGDIFISLHVNYSRFNPEARGTEIYFVSEKGASDRETEILVRRENITDIAAKKFDFPQKDNQLSYILVDLAKRSIINQSTQLALNISETLKRDGKIKVRHVKRAPFSVLKTLRVPSVLVEVGFISNSTDRRLMISGAYLKKYAKLLAKGLMNFYHNTLQRVTLKFNETTNSE